MKLSPDSLLLSTRLKIPAPRKNYVARRALFGQLAQCSEMGVVFVRGAAGTGKTTLLSSFLREAELPNVGWLTVDPSIANVHSFWLYFTAAARGFLDDGGLLELMRSNPDSAHMENLLTLLINRLCDVGDCTMALDDVHCIRDAALARTLEFFLGAMPENVHLFLLSREDPPVYLGPLAMAGRLLYIDSRQMALTPEEGMQFLRQTLGLAASDAELRRLTDYAEGWVGGLQLAAAAGAQRFSENLLRAGGGIAAEYLTREIFESLLPEEREFLTGTGFLPYFDAAVCASLFDSFSKPRFDAMVERLTRKNLFILCMDEQNGVYRYHNILSDYLAQQFSRLPEERRQSLHARAADAYERRGDLEEALRQYCAAGDYGSVLRAAHGMDGNIEAWGCLNLVPSERLIGDPDLTAQCFLYNLGNLDLERCRVLYRKFQERYGDSDIFRALQFARPYLENSRGILPEYSALTPEQIEALPLGDASKAVIRVENTAALLSEARYTEAEVCVRQSLCSERDFIRFLAYDQLAQLFEETGRLNESLDAYAQARSLFSESSLFSGFSTNYYFGIAGVYMRRMELERAEEALRNAKETLDSHRFHMDVADMTLAFHLAELKFLRGDAEGGARAVEGIRSEYPAYSVLALGRLVHELDCAGLLGGALADAFLLALEQTPNYRDQPFFRLLRARLLFERGNAAEGLAETERVLAFCRASQNRLWLVEGDLLKLRMLEQNAAAREKAGLLRETVFYAHRDRILMPFYLNRAFLAAPLAALSGMAASQSGLSAPEAAFAREAAALCAHTPCAPASAKSEPEGERLSAREAEVLGELARGITNREIAQRLCISQATVKTHVLSIFGKLGVSSRTMAVEEGRKKGLLP